MNEKVGTECSILARVLPNRICVSGHEKAPQWSARSSESHDVEWLKTLADLDRSDERHRIE
jgi:hypothetical protein